MAVVFVYGIQAGGWIVGIGTVTWMDLCVPDAVAVRDFYAGVVGVTHSAVPMGGYDDFCLIPPGTDDAVAGVCHARGSNADLPPVWMIYFNVADIQASVQEVLSRGGRVLREPKSCGGVMIAIIQDPAGAVCGLAQQPAS
jgi:uncharacterized protein